MTGGGIERKRSQKRRKRQEKKKNGDLTRKQSWTQTRRSRCMHAERTKRGTPDMQDTRSARSAPYFRSIRRVAAEGRRCRCRRASTVVGTIKNFVQKMMKKWTVNVPEKIATERLFDKHARSRDPLNSSDILHHHGRNVGIPSQR